MVKKGYKQTEEHKKKIGLANARILKGRICSPVGLDKIIKINRDRKKGLGYVTSDETRKKMSNNMKEKWRIGDISPKQKERFHDGKAKGGFATRFKKGHQVPQSWREAVRKSRSIQKFPSKDTKIEIKIQTLLESLEIEYIKHWYVKDIELKYRCDIFIPSRKLVIECDGDYWHAHPLKYSKDQLNQRQKEQRIRDRLRTDQMIQKGFKVLRIWEEDIKKMNEQELLNQIQEVSK